MSVCALPIRNSSFISFITSLQYLVHIFLRRALYVVHGHLGTTEGAAAAFGERMSAPPLLLSLTNGPGQATTKGLVSWWGEPAFMLMKEYFERITAINLV